MMITHSQPPSADYTPGDQCILLMDIKSNMRGGNLYGKKGEKVKVISTSGDVFIVEGKERFPVNIKYLQKL